KSPDGGSRPFYSQQGPLLGSSLRYSGRSRVLSARESSLLHETVVDAQWASRPQQGAWRRGQYRTAWARLVYWSRRSARGKDGWCALEDVCTNWRRRAPGGQ